MRRALTTALTLALTLAIPAAPVAAQEADPQAAPATRLRVALDRILAEHAFLIVDAVRLGVEGGPEFEAAADALEENSTRLIDAIAGIYGDEAGDAVGVQWRNHHAYLIDYARAVAANDREAAAVADQQLRRYISDFASLLTSAITPLTDEVVASLVEEHVDQIEQIAAFDAADFGSAYPAVRATHEHMYMIGDGLSLGIVNQFPERFTGGVFAFSPATDMRLLLDRLLGEHTELASLAMRATLSGAPDASAAADALDDNANELADTIGSIYGADAAAAFDTLWTRHLRLYLRYVTGLRDNDAADLTAARNGLAGYTVEFTDFLAGANPFLSASDFETLLGDHTDHLLTQADEFAAGDYRGAYAAGHAGFEHSGELSAGLAAAIADQFPLLFPDTATGQSPAPASPGDPLGRSWPLAALLGLAGLWASIWLTRRRRFGGVGG
jgi:hypothetical protein